MWGRSCETTLVRYSRTPLDTRVGHPHTCRSLCRSLLRARVEHSCRTILRDTLVGHTLAGYRTLGGHSCGLVGQSCGARFWGTTTKVSKVNRHGDLLQKSHVKSAKRAFRARPPQKLTLQVSKTNVSHKTSSKTHTSSLQNERFV